MKKMNVLLMVPAFYGLGKVIENELIAKGHKLTVIESRIFKEDFRLLKTFVSFFFFLLNPFYKIKDTKKVINKFNNQKFDIFLTVGYLSTTSNFIKQLKIRNPNIKTILYLWDSFLTWDFSYLLSYFDYKYSFDRLDCKKYSFDNLVYMPLFYDQFDMKHSHIYDITHIGTINEHYINRIPILDAVTVQARRYGLKTYIRSYAYCLNNSFFQKRKIRALLRDRFKYIFNSKLRKHIVLLQKYKDSDFLCATSLSPQKVNKIENESKCILDINLKNAGVSYRIIRALSQGKKVITTNEHIINEDFYCTENISIIDKINPIIDINFLNTPTKEVDISYLRIDNWIKKIFMDIGVFS